jgi:hypothetical protein
LLKNIQVESAFPYALSPCHKGAKWDTIGVARGANAKLPHYTSLALTYPMKNEMSFVHHVIKWWGCDYIIEDGKSLNERTRRHPMLKPMSKWCRRGGNKGKYWAKMITKVWIRWIGCLTGMLMIS